MALLRSWRAPDSVRGACLRAWWAVRSTGQRRLPGMEHMEHMDHMDHMEHLYLRYLRYLRHLRHHRSPFCHSLWLPASLPLGTAHAPAKIWRPPRSTLHQVVRASSTRELSSGPMVSTTTRSSPRLLHTTSLPRDSSCSQHI